MNRRNLFIYLAFSHKRLKGGLNNALEILYQSTMRSEKIRRQVLWLVTNIKKILNLVTQIDK